MSQLEETQFQGVACCCLDSNRTVKETIIKLLDLETSSKHRNIECYDLRLTNKYYQATINLFDCNSVPEEELSEATSVLKDCHAIILYANGLTLSTEQLDVKLALLKPVGGEPRVLLCEGIDEECESHKNLLDWCIKNGFDLLLTGEEGIRDQLIESLSAYKWAFRSDSHPTGAKSNDQRGGDSSNNNPPQLSEDLLKKLMDFDSLLGKISAYRDQPELRGDPNDKNIEEIAEILSGLLGDEVDNFLENEATTPPDHSDTNSSANDNSCP